MTSGQTRFQQFMLRKSIPPRIKNKLDRYKQDTEETADDHKTYKRIEELFAGKYEPIGVLRRGGMGSVYFAMHKELKSLVLVKTLNPEYSIDKSSVERFESEAIVAKRIRHPGIVEIYDLATWTGTEKDEITDAEKTVKQKFIVMEHINGLDLDDKVEQLSLLAKKLTSNEIAKIGCLAAKALAAAHKEGVIHRDLKPGNIMLVENGELGVKIIDFGIAKDDDPDSDVSRTVAGQVFGTCSYMAPEQAKGERITAKTDIYGLGATLYELCEGRAPFEGTSVGEIAAKVIRDKLPPIVNPEIDERLREIIYRCMDKDASKRYDTMDDLARELATFENRHERVDAPDGMIGTIIEGKNGGSYRIQRQVGVGTETGSYFVAKDMNATIERLVTVKVTPQAASRNWRERARKEVETLSRINHPNIARPIDYREEADKFDVVFDFVPEASLREFNVHTLAEEDRLSIAIQATEAIRYAHANGIIHRDIKPGSVFVEMVIGSEPVVKIANFGFAKEVAIDAGLTIAGKIVGANNEYMSPEQKAGVALDQKTDVYSMGLVLREMIFGIKPEDNVQWVNLRRSTSDQDKELYKLIGACLSEKERRPDMNYVNRTLRDVAATRRTSRISIKDEPTVERPAYNPPLATATQQGYGTPQPAPYIAAAPVQPVAAVPDVALPPAQPPQARDSPESLVGEETLHNVDLDTLLGKNKASKAKLIGGIVAGVAAIGILTATIGLKISNSRQRPNEPRIETIMRDSGPVITVPTPVDAPTIEHDAAASEDAQAQPQDAQLAQTTRITINANVSGYKVYLMDGTEVCSSGRNNGCQFEINTNGQTQLELRKGARRVQLTIDAQGNPVETSATFPRVRRRFEEVEGM